MGGKDLALLHELCDLLDEVAEASKGEGSVGVGDSTVTELC
jgi:hypothetical protein